MKLTEKEIDTILTALDNLVDLEQDTINHSELIEKLNLEIGRICCASCGDWVVMNSEELLNTHHVQCGGEVK